MDNRGVLISGAGVAGSMLAFWWGWHGYAVTPVERAPAPRRGGYMLDCWGRGLGVGVCPSAPDALVPDLHRKSLDDIATFR